MLVWDACFAFSRPSGTVVLSDGSTSVVDVTVLAASAGGADQGDGVVAVPPTIFMSESAHGSDGYERIVRLPGTSATDILAVDVPNGLPFEARVADTDDGAVITLTRGSEPDGSAAGIASGRYVVTVQLASGDEIVIPVTVSP